MEPFTFNRQTIAFLCVIAAVELVIVLVFPLLAIALGALAALLLPIVWIKTGIRSGKWLWLNPVAVPLTQFEGALALSAALLLSVGALEVGHEALRVASGKRDLLTGYFFPLIGAGPPSERRIGSSSVNYGDPGTQQQLKDALTKAGIPYSVETRDGTEYVVWTSQYNAAVEKIQREMEEPFTAGHNVSFDDPKQEREFREWLKKRGISNEIVTSGGKKFIVWKDGPKDLMMQFMDENSSRCPRDKPASAPGKAKAPRC